MLVNELAKVAGVDPNVIRYYTRIGLLQPARHPDNGYKLFRPSDVRRLEWIRRAQELGFGLAEIASMLVAKERGEPCCARLREGLRRNIKRNRTRLAELSALQARMEAALRDWEHGQAGPGFELAAATITEGFSPESSTLSAG